MEKIITTVKEKWQIIAIVTLITTAVVFSITAFIPPKFSSEVSMIVIQKQASYKVDAFSAAKSAEYLSDILSKVIYTEAFMDDALSAPYEIKKQFSPIPEERKKQWEKEVKVEKENNTGIIQVTVFDASREEAEKIAQSVAWSFSVRGQKYHGGGERVKVELIDGPITSIRPSSPNILLNTLLALVVGFIGSLALIFYFKDFDLKVFNTKRKKSGKNDSWLKEKIRQQFQRNFPAGIIAEENYKIEKKEDLKMPEENEEENIIIPDEEIEKEASDEPVVYEEVKEISDTSGRASAPENLPIFMDENQPDNFADMTELGNEKLDKFPNDSHNDEPSENEVKERLNKLLKGNL